MTKNKEFYNWDLNLPPYKNDEDRISINFATYDVKDYFNINIKSTKNDIGITITPEEAIAIRDELNRVYPINNEISCESINDKWEYRTLFNPSAPDIQLNYLGKEGWELVNFYQRTYVLKRKLDNS